MYDTVLYEKRNSVGILSLNRPERMNAVIEAMYREMGSVLEEVRRDDSVRSLILTGSSFRKGDIVRQAFCAGADLKEHASGRRDHRAKRLYIELAHATTRALHDFPKPVLAAVNGAARGAGAEMALNCDILMMAHEATIAFPETGLATFVGGGVTWILPRLVGLMKARELIYTGRVLTGPEAAACGLALGSYPAGELMQEALALAASLAEKGPLSLRLAKEHLWKSSERNLETALHMETDAILACMDTEDWAEGVAAFAEKRKPVYRGR